MLNIIKLGSNLRRGGIPSDLGLLNLTTIELVSTNLLASVPSEL